MRIRVLAGAFAALALIFGASAAQAAPQVQTLVNMSNDGPADNGDNEVDIAINPTNPANMIAGWKLLRRRLQHGRRQDLEHRLAARHDPGRR